MSEEQQPTAQPDHLIRSKFWPWICVGLCTMLGKVYYDKNNSDTRLIDNTLKSANEKVEMQREVTALQRELYFKTERVIAATNRLDSSRAFDSPATDTKPRAGE